MSLNPQVEALLAMFASMPPVDYATITPDGLRALNDNPMQMGPPPAVASARDVEIALPGRTLPGRLYIPEDAGENPPLVVFYHGGGWVIGTIETHDGTCRALARESSAAVLSVAYRLAPEAPFPAPLDDCYEALVWAKDNAAKLGIDGTRLAVAGDSAGGNLAAVVALAARDAGDLPIRFQLLIYPATDAHCGTDSYHANGQGYLLTKDTMAYFYGHYIDDEGHKDDWRASPLRAASHANLPPALVITAGFDPLRDEGLAYAHRLSDAGNRATQVSFERQIHGFITMGKVIDESNAAVALCASMLRDALAPRG